MAKKTSIGGQALMEGIMMVGPEKTVAAFINEKKEIETEEFKFKYVRDKYKIVKLPFLRGIFNFVDTLRLGMMAMEKSTDRIEFEEEESKLDKWLEEKLGDKTTKIIMAVAGVIAVALSIFLFMYLPALAFTGIEKLFGEGINSLRSVFEGVIRALIFVGYSLAISFIPDIKRVFRFHGAEHKTIFCYENELPLTVENVRIQKRFHPRCGTSFLVILIILGIIVGMFIPFTDPIIRTFCKLLTLPLVVGVGYELIKLAGRHDNLFTKIISAPGMWVQRITTKEPDDDMIRTAIAAMLEVIPENGEDLI